MDDNIIWTPDEQERQRKEAEKLVRELTQAQSKLIPVNSIVAPTPTSGIYGGIRRLSLKNISPYDDASDSLKYLFNLFNPPYPVFREYTPEEREAMRKEQARLINRIKRKYQEAKRRLSNAWQSLKGAEWD